MSFLSRLGTWRLDDGVSPLATAALSSYQLGGSADVAQLVNYPASIAAAFGLTPDSTVTRADAMRVPTVRRARQVIAGTIGAQPLIAHRRNPDGSVVDVTAERRILTQPDPHTTLQYVLTWTVDSLVFYGVAWWLVTDRDPEGFPRAACWLRPDRVRVDLAEQRVYVDGDLVADADLLRFDGPDEGLLAYGGPTLATSRQLDAAVRRLASGDVPLGALKLQEGADELSTEPFTCGIAGDARSEVDALLDAWEDARRQRSTAYLNRAVDFTTYTVDARGAQLAEGRQQQRIDEANICNVPPRVVNAPSASTMTYSNAVAERADLVDTSLSGYVVAVEQRLSLPDVTPRGTFVRFDLARYLSGDPLSAMTLAAQAVTLGAMTAGEVRTDVLGRTPLPAAPATPTPPTMPTPPAGGPPA